MYCLGLFAVVSCLKKETYTVPTKGLSLKLNADPRICLNYPPGCFAAPVIAQTMVRTEKHRFAHLTLHSRAVDAGPERGVNKGHCSSLPRLRSSRWTRPFWLLPSPGRTPTIQWCPQVRFSTSPTRPLSP